MRSTELHTSRAMLRWLRTMMVASGALGGAGCSWVPAKDVLEIKEPAREPHELEGGYLNRQECLRLCKATRHDKTPDRCMLVTMAVAPREYDVSDATPAVAELVAAETPSSDAKAPTRADPTSAQSPEPRAAVGPKSAEVAVLCERHLPGYFETFKGFGRGSLAAAELFEPPRSAAEHYLRAAYAETAAILSFQQLAFDLEALGASRRLIRAARRAAREEASHARVSLAAARRLGVARPRWPSLPRPVRRTPRLVDMALENATSGCVSEIFGAYLQLHQARHAKDPELRAIAGRIAREEASHAALALRLFDYLDVRLTPDQRLSVRASMREELSRCEASLAHSPELLHELGLPDRAEVRSMMRQIEASLPMFTVS